MITIAHRKHNRGTKRKAYNQTNDRHSKRRRLNSSESQSYSINNGNQHIDNDGDDDCVISDKIELDFVINFAAATNPSSAYSKS